MKLRYRIMDFVNNSIVPSGFKYDAGDLELLKKADDLNRKISREAIYFYKGDSDGLVLLNNKDYNKILISDNEILINEAAKDANNKIFRDEKSFLKFAGSKQYGDWAGQSGKKSTVLYYHVDKVDTALAEDISGAARNTGIIEIIIATGNPFPLGTLSCVPPALITFSNTRESITGAAACLNGEFIPKKEINIRLGFHGHRK
jgi:hypothetical protein